VATQNDSEAKLGVSCYVHPMNQMKMGEENNAAETASGSRD